MKHAEDISKRLLGATLESLDPSTRNVVHHIAGKKHLAKHPDRIDRPSSLGERAADAVARFGGSWVFIGLFASTLVAWVVLNTVLVAKHGQTFDPYPYILLNLFLSMLASVQAPIILMSQNRQGVKDRQSAMHDYEINLRAELEIMMLHQKIDQLREVQWNELLEMQKQQLSLLRDLPDGGLKSQQVFEVKKPA
jgi:uncharacterized membrane protein